jgi:Sigma-70 factor, region 1.1
MASKTEETLQKEEMLEKDGPETLPDSPLLDLSDPAVKELIRSAKKRGYVTHDQINSVLPSEEVNSEQIEDVLGIFRTFCSPPPVCPPCFRLWRLTASPTGTAAIPAIPRSRLSFESASHGIPFSFRSIRLNARVHRAPPQRFSTD